jgi:hypothetical protein
MSIVRNRHIVDCFDMRSSTKSLNGCDEAFGAWVKGVLRDWLGVLLAPSGRCLVFAVSITRCFREGDEPCTGFCW